MPEPLQTNLYDHPRYYDLVFGSDWAAEFHFLKACFEKHATGEVTKLFEPACGTGRLMFRLAKAGYDVAGCDLNEKAVDFCNARLKRHQLPETAFVGDMADFNLGRTVDAAFNTINSFRHLGTQKGAESHLKCVADHLREGGIYVLGLHLTPEDDDWYGEEEWSARRGNLSIISQMWTEAFDRDERMETLGMSFDVRTPTEHLTLRDDMKYRTYTRRQMDALLKTAAGFGLELRETYDFCYDIADPVVVDDETEDVVYVLRKVRGGRRASGVERLENAPRSAVADGRRAPLQSPPPAGAAPCPIRTRPNPTRTTTSTRARTSPPSRPRRPAPGTS